MPKAQANKTDFNIMIVLFIFVENLILYDIIHDFSVWLRSHNGDKDKSLPDTSRFCTNSVLYSGHRLPSLAHIFII